MIKVWPKINETKQKSTFWRSQQIKLSRQPSQQTRNKLPKNDNDKSFDQK